MYTRTRRLPIVFTPLDVESKTKPLPAVICPVRGSLLTVGTCGQCPGFARIEFNVYSKPVLACAASAPPEPTLHRFVALPTVCAAEDTRLATLQQHLESEPEQSCVPVLDRRARPVGLVPIAALRREIANASQLDVPASKLADPQFLRASPHMTLGDAQRLLTATEGREIVVVNHDESFSGLVQARDLAN
ncbi:MAG TPA: CBS domain-containing protein [Polyangiales bacterium]|nr:CBS domain-containing protein [Polyangiales bacterium]